MKNKSIPLIITITLATSMIINPVIALAYDQENIDSKLNDIIKIVDLKDNSSDDINMQEDNILNNTNKQNDNFLNINSDHENRSLDNPIEQDSNSLNNNYNQESITLDDINKLDDNTLDICTSCSEENPHVINNIDDLKNIDNHLDGHFKLGSNLNLVNETDFRIGSVDSPFTGTFDGGGHTISNLNITSSIQLSGGLFVKTENAKISNLIIDNADVALNFNGGILIGKMIGGNISNVSIRNSKLNVDVLSSGISLLDSTGLYGGALVGINEGGVISNCESINTRVETYIDEIVKGVEFGNLYLGGLVGKNINGQLKLCRSIDGQVKNCISTTVSALSGKVLYSGGLVGWNDGDIINSYNNNYVSFDGRIYVSVGAGLNGYAGGLAGYMGSGKIENSHYAGKIESYLENAALIVPVITNNKNLAGLIGSISSGVENNIKHSYFNWDNAVADKKTPDIPAIRDKSDSENYKNLSKEDYLNKDNFIGWDFENIWIIDSGNQDESKRMPIHGKDSNSKSSINVDTDDDGLPDINLDFDNDGVPDINVDTDDDNIPNINIDTDGDGLPDVNVDLDNDGIADTNINNNITQWIPNKDVDINKDGVPDYDTDDTIKPEESKINVSVPLNMKFAVVGNLVGEEKFASPTYEIINSGNTNVNISVTEFKGESENFIPVVDNTQVFDTDSADKHISLDLQLGDENPVNLKTSEFSETELGSVNKNETKELKFVNAKYGRDFSKFKEADNNKNTSYNMTWKISQSSN